MTIGGINVEQSIKNARRVIETDKTLSASTRTVFEVLLLVIGLFSDLLVTVKTVVNRVLQTPIEKRNRDPVVLKSWVAKKRPDWKDA